MDRAITTDCSATVFTLQISTDSKPSGRPSDTLNRFGGLYPNPSLTGAAVAVMTERIGIRAGSVVIPLQDPLRVAEEWSVVDNLSQGRVGVSFASGWNVNDFVLEPDTYDRRKDLMYERIETVQRLWRGESVSRTNGMRNEVDISIFPKPLQPEIPIWVTAQSEHTCVRTGEIGANLLTNLNYSNFDELRAKIGAYRKAFAEYARGNPGVHDRGHVTVMVHTYVAEQRLIESQGKPAYARYLRTNLDLQSERAKGLGLTIDSTEEDIEFIVSRALDRMINRVGLIGSPAECLEQANRFADLGIDEVACLIDFGVEYEHVMTSLGHLAALAADFAQRSG